MATAARGGSRGGRTKPQAPWEGATTVVRWGFGVRGPCLDSAPSPVRGLGCGPSPSRLTVPEACDTLYSRGKRTF